MVGPPEKYFNAIRHVTVPVLSLKVFHFHFSLLGYQGKPKTSSFAAFSSLKEDCVDNIYALIVYRFTKRCQAGWNVTVPVHRLIIFQFFQIPHSGRCDYIHSSFSCGGPNRGWWCCYYVGLSSTSRLLVRFAQTSHVAQFFHHCQIFCFYFCRVLLTVCYSFSRM